MQIVCTTCTMSNVPNKKANSDLASKSNACATATDVTLKKDHSDDIVTCKVCRQDLSATEFSNSKLKKFRKAKAKGKHMQIVCTTCTMPNVPNKKASGSEAANQLGNGRDATASKSRPGNGKGIERSPNKFQSQQRSSKANASSSQSAAKTKSRDTDKQPREVMTAAANRIATQPQPLPANRTTTPTLTLTRVLRLTHN